MKWLVMMAAGLLVVASAATTVQANLLTNGSFETGDLTGWTDGGNTGWNSVGGAPAPGEGLFGVSNGAVGSLSLLSQTVTTVPGETYAISFWLQNDGGGIFQVRFDGALLFSEAFVGHGYEFHTVLGTASGSSTVLELASQDDPGFIQFDGISVTGAQAVPEPTTLSMFGLGALGMIGAAARKWRRKAVAN